MIGRRWRLACAVAAAALLAPAAAARLEPLGDSGLHGWWFPLPQHADADVERRPAVIALHGCGGLYRRDGQTLEARYPDYVEWLHARGIHVLLPDSFSWRGERSICTQRARERRVDTSVRSADVQAALAWLRQRREVDRERIVLLGWSHGASTALAAINGAVAPALPLAGAVLFYPGCQAALKRAFATAHPTLLLLGELDDWTPPQPCMELVERTRRLQPAADLTLRLYPQAHHGFDGTAPLRFRADVPGGVSGAGVHSGGEPQARAAARAELGRFLDRVLGGAR